MTDMETTWLKLEYLDMVRFDCDELQVKVVLCSMDKGQTHVLDFRLRFLSGMHFRTLSSSHV